MHAGAELGEDGILQLERVVDVAEIEDDVAVGRGVERRVEDEEVEIGAAGQVVDARPADQSVVTFLI